MIDTLGTHLLIEFFDCDNVILDSVEHIEVILNKAAKAANAIPVGSRFHRFQPSGTSGIILLAESHISIHTWPNEGYAAVDFFTCGSAKPEAGIPILEKELKAGTFELLEVSRGQLSKTNSIEVLKHKRFQRSQEMEKEE